ncbi:MAG: AI-2E family transporter [gamma proteobacterium symbiont of Taylorina sp.]|nr:AI-2E family transporter [gamma proteobacterium symbiont of Taylorina sp.]
MNNPQEKMSNAKIEKNVINLTVKLGILLLLFYWCFSIIQPFIIPVLWAVVIAVSLYPLYQIILPRLKGKRGLTGTVFTLVTLAMLLTPVFMLSGSMIDGVQHVSKAVEEGTLKVPAPPANVKEWPLIGENIYTTWQLASANIDEAIVKFTPQIKTLGKTAFSAIMGGGAGVLLFFISIIIAGALMVNAEGAVKALQNFTAKLSPNYGLEFVNTATLTIRSVAQGVIGIAIVQATFVGIGFWAVDVPGAGLWALFVLILSIAQMPPFLVILPVIAYVFSLDDISTITLIIFTIWSVFGGILDGILKPFVMGRGMDIPMLVILLGAIGGMIMSGILGLFTGAIVLALGYMLYTQWLSSDDTPAEEK